MLFWYVYGRRSNALTPNIMIDEHMLKSRVQERHPQSEREYLLTLSSQPRRNVLPRLMGGLGARLVALGTRTQRLEQQ